MGKENTVGRMAVSTKVSGTGQSRDLAVWGQSWNNMSVFSCDFHVCFGRRNISCYY